MVRRRTTGNASGEAEDRNAKAIDEREAMKIIMFTRDNALRFWSHGKETTIRAAGKSGKPRHKKGDAVSLRVWLDKAYRSKTYEFGSAVVRGVESVRIMCDKLEIQETAIGSIGKLIAAQRDGFDNWEELKAALNLHHGAELNGFRYFLSEINLHSKAVLLGPAVAQ
jgi:hypothetical protein